MINLAEPIKKLTVEKAMKNGTEQPQICKNFLKEREKAKGFASNQQKGKTSNPKNSKHKVVKSASLE